METFLSLLIELKDLVGDVIAFALSRLANDRRVLVKTILGLLVAVVAIVGVCKVVSHSRQVREAGEADPESQMVIPISIPAVQTPTPQPTQGLSTASAAAAAGGVAVGSNTTQGTSAVNTAGAGNSGTNTPATARNTAPGVVSVVNEYLQKKGSATVYTASGAAANPVPTPITYLSDTDYDYEATYFNGSYGDDYEDDEEYYDDEDYEYEDYDDEEYYDDEDYEYEDYDDEEYHEDEEEYEDY